VGFFSAVGAAAFVDGACATVGAEEAAAGSFSAAGAAALDAGPCATVRAAGATGGDWATGGTTVLRLPVCQKIKPMAMTTNAARAAQNQRVIICRIQLLWASIRIV
jgi:hypothetical protein